MPVGRRLSSGFVILPPRPSSSAPKFTVNAMCCSSVIGWSWNTSTAYRSMPASTAATSSRDSGLVTSIPDTSPTNTGWIWRIETLIAVSSSAKDFEAGRGPGASAEAHHSLRRIRPERVEVRAHALAQHLHVRELPREVAVALLRVEVQVEEARVRVALRDTGEAAGAVHVGVVVAGRREHPLVLAHAERGEGVDEPVVVVLAAREAVRRQQERGLVDTVHVSIRGDAIGCASERERRRQQIAEVQEAVAHAVGIDHSRPHEERRHPHAAFPRRALGAAERRVGGVGPRLHVRPVIRRHHDQRVLRAVPSPRARARAGPRCRPARAACPCRDAERATRRGSARADSCRSGRPRVQ